MENGVEGATVERAVSPFELQQADALVGAAVAAAVSPVTRRSYVNAWRHYSQWCQGLGLPPAPIVAANVARFLAARAAEVDAWGAPRYKATTLSVWLSGLGRIAADNGWPLPGTDRRVRDTLAGIRRTRGVRPTRMKPLALPELRSVLEPIQPRLWPDGVKATRDMAILLVGFAGAFRRSELAALTPADVETQPGAAHVLVARSKTDQEGHGQVRYLPRGERASTCPLCALCRWQRLVALADQGVPRSALMGVLLNSNLDIHVCDDEAPRLSAAGLARPLFRQVSRWGSISSSGLSGQSIHQVVRDRVQAAGFNPRAFGGHSLRAGFVTEALRAGADTHSVRRQTGHQSDAVLAIYDRDYNPGTNNAVSRLDL